MSVEHLNPRITFSSGTVEEFDKQSRRRGVHSGLIGETGLRECLHVLIRDLTVHRQDWEGLVPGASLDRFLPSAATGDGACIVSVRNKEAWRAYHEHTLNRRAGFEV